MNILRKALRILFKPIYLLSRYLYPENENALNDMSDRLNDMSNRMNDMSNRMNDVSDRMNNVSDRIDMYYNNNEIVTENVRNLNAMLDGYDKVIINIQNLNSEMDKVMADQDRLHFMMGQLHKKAVIQAAKPSSDSDTPEKQPVSNDPDDNYCAIDYFDFENYFRGTREQIKQRQTEYLPLFKDCKTVLDIGCGRGEFLELMQDNNISAVGVDTYEPFVGYCREKGFDTVCRDGIEYLSSSDGFDGIFAGQVIEHLSVQQIIALIDAAYEKLSDKGVLVLETPNPRSLSIYCNAFYLDPSHMKPVHPETLRYLLKNAGFTHIDIIYTKASKPDITIPKIDGQDEFNLAMEKVQDMLFGSQDYAVIARK